MTTLTFEDFKPGHFGTFGPRHVTREEILAFAAEFDPQPMHLDEEAAKRSMLKGLSGSGWHLCSLHDADDVRRLHRPHRLAGLARRQRGALAGAAAARRRPDARCRRRGGAGVEKPARDRHRHVQGHGAQRGRRRRCARWCRRSSSRAPTRRRSRPDAFLRGHGNRPAARARLVHLHRRGDQDVRRASSIRSAFISTRRRAASRCSAGWPRPAGMSARSA